MVDVPSPEEPIHPQLEALAFENFDHLEHWRVYADWLEERGEPRGALIREQVNTPPPIDPPRVPRFSFISPPAAQQIVSTNWSRWFPSVPQHAVRFGWLNGFVRSAFVYNTVARDWSREVLLSPSARFVRALRIVVFSDTLPMVQDVPLRLLETLHLEVKSQLTAQAISALTKMRLPRLRSLSVSPDLTDTGEFIAAIVGAPWFRQLESLAFSVVNEEVVGVLARHLRGRRRLRLRLRVTDPVWQSNARGELRLMFPDAEFERVRFGGRAKTSPTPSVAPANFRTLPPWEEVRSEGRNDQHHSTWIGSGSPSEQVRPHAACGCTACGSSETNCIFHSHSSYYSRKGNSDYYTWEVECCDCGFFTVREESYD